MSLVDITNLNRILHEENIYVCLREPPILTVVIGAKCSDGIAMIADKKLTDLSGGDPQFRNKIYGDLGHILMGYTGLEGMFDIFRKYVVGEVQLVFSSNPYTFDNIMSRCSNPLGLLNTISSRHEYSLELLIAKHHKKDSELYHFSTNGDYNTVDYIAIGSGKDAADMLCKPLPFKEMTMRNFIKEAYFAIKYMEQYCPGLGVGVESGGVPSIKYLDYEQVWDKEPEIADIEGYETYANERLEKVKQTLKGFRQPI
jgi:20S proteasome alpha/beta subunit